MYNKIIPILWEKSSLSLTEKLRDQFKETFDLIIHHEWMIDLLNNKLTLKQFQSFMTQEAYIYDFLARQALNFAINQSDEDYDELMRIGIFLYSEASENLRPIDIESLISCPTKNYCEELENIWNSASYPHKLLTILVQLWIREGIYYVLASEKTYFHGFKVWTERISNASPQELVSALSRILHQSFIKNYSQDEEALIYQEVFKDLENFLSSVTQFELAIRNHSYQINFN
ncbi:hypothetical protein IM40_10535 (plasmid) [Candidatus Paracaedimonas acanthamoebae]|nr:hypothetical protein IM40_10535 [Candidatus Paracaedimonas acanthamoebae]